MAIVDRSTGELVLRVVYDGPATAGKTTSVRALGRALGGAVTTSAEAGERTLFFDWLEHSGGLVEGRPMRCQVVTVPGQSLLARRRAALLRDADAIVYVSAVTAGTIDAVVGALASVRASCPSGDTVPTGIVLQANKRDLPDAVGLGEVRAALDGARLPVAIVESTATQGTGVLEAFLLAVRLALDRIREQARTGTLTIADAETEARLLARIAAEDVVRTRASEVPPAHDAPLQAIPRAHARTSRSSAPPRPPDASVAPGCVWPPIEGRVVLSEAIRAPLDVVRVRGGWAASADGWRLQAPHGGEIARGEDPRAALLAWASMHARHQHLLSFPRCIVLADDGDGGARLWQIVRARESMRERLAALLDERDGEAIGRALAEVASRWIDLERAVRSSSAPLPLTLDTIGAVAGETRYVGIVPLDRIASARGTDVAKELSRVAADWRPLAPSIVSALERERERTDDGELRACLAALSRALVSA